MTEQQRDTLELIHRQHKVEMPLDDFIQSATPEIGWPDHLIGITPDGWKHT